MPLALQFLGATSNSSKAFSSVVFWSVGLIGLVILMAVLIMWVRRQMSPKDDPQPQGFTLADLRELHRKGQMSDAEFERAKGLLVQSLKATGSRPENTAGPGEHRPPPPPQKPGSA